MEYEIVSDEFSGQLKIPQNAFVAYIEKKYWINFEDAIDLSFVASIYVAEYARRDRKARNAMDEKLMYAPTPLRKLSKLCGNEETKNKIYRTELNLDREWDDFMLATIIAKGNPETLTILKNKWRNTACIWSLTNAFINKGVMGNFDKLISLGVPRKEILRNIEEWMNKSTYGPFIRKAKKAYRYVKAIR